MTIIRSVAALLFVASCVPAQQGPMNTITLRGGTQITNFLAVDVLIPSQYQPRLSAAWLKARFDNLGTSEPDDTLADQRFLVIIVIGDKREKIIDVIDIYEMRLLNTSVFSIFHPGRFHDSAIADFSQSLAANEQHVGPADRYYSTGSGVVTGAEILKYRATPHKEEPSGFLEPYKAHN